MVSAERVEQPTNAVLLEEIKRLGGEITQLKGLRDEVKRLSTRPDEAYKIIDHQQKFLETLDARERRRNIIITGLREGGDSGDVDKVRTVLCAIGLQNDARVQPDSWEIKRLGRVSQGRTRPLLVALNDSGIQDKVLERAKDLKGAEGDLAAVYIKKDLHPAVRKEMARLREREKQEKSKPENVGTNIRYDWKNRVLVRDNEVIDRYAPSFFVASQQAS